MGTVVGASPGVIASGVHKKAPVFPLTIPWHSAFWASDPDWVPPANGGLVPSWRNAGTSGAAAVESDATYQPTYRASYANLNSKPAVEFASGDWLLSNSPSINQPNHVVVVGWLDPSASNNASPYEGGNGRTFGRLQADGSGLMYAGASVTIPGGGRRGTPYVLAALFNGASSTYRINGTAYTVPSSPGSNPYAQVKIASFYFGASGADTTHVGGIAFLGVINRALTAQEISNLETWAHNTYGVTIP